MKHFPRKGTGTDLVAICDRYTAESIGDVGDERRDRFTTDESVILDPATGCTYCREVLVEASAKPVTPQVWQHADVLERALRGELDDAIKPWPTWRSALRSYVMWQDGGASIRSSGDPGRFEAIPSGYSGPPGGDYAQRQAERLCRVGEALLSSMVGGFVVATYPERVTLPDAVCRQIVVTLVAGRDIDQRTGGSGRWLKQKVRQRLPIRDDDEPDPEKRRTPHAIVAAEVSLRVGYEVTAGHVMTIERAAGVEIQEVLSARGLVLHDDENLRRAEAADMSKVLVGWKSIVAHLGEGWSEDRAQAARSWDPPIPARVVGGRVEAEADDLDDWRRRGPVPAKKGAA